MRRKFTAKKILTFGALAAGVYYLFHRAQGGVAGLSATFADRTLENARHVVPFASKYAAKRTISPSAFPPVPTPGPVALTLARRPRLQTAGRSPGVYNPWKRRMDRSSWSVKDRQPWRR